MCADWVLAREGIVLNPHSRGMGGLYGSEYWFCSLTKRVGQGFMEKPTERCLPISMHKDKVTVLIDEFVIQNDPGDASISRFRGSYRPHRRVSGLQLTAAVLAGPQAGQARRRRGNQVPSEYRLDELAPTNANLRGEYPNHHLARTAFARKHPRLERLESAMAIEKAFVDAHDDVVKAAGENRYALANLGWGWAEMR